MKDAHDVSVVDDPQFQELFRRRSRLRWSLTLVLVVTYLVYSLAGIYTSELLGRKFMNSAASWWIVIGLVLIVLSIALSLVYVRIVRKLYGSQSGNATGAR